MTQRHHQKDNTISERVARLETSQKYMIQTLDEIKESIQEMQGETQKISKDFSKWHGVAAGAILTISAIGGLVTFAWGFIKHKFGA